MQGPDIPIAQRTDPELMALAAEGSAPAFAEIVRRHQNGLLNFFRRMGVYTEAEDLSQDTFLRLFRQRFRYRPVAKFTTFLYTLARSVWVDHVRRCGRAERLRLGLEAEPAVADAPAPRPMGQCMDAESALNSLSPKLREVLVLNVLQGLRYQDVAEVLGIPLGTVKSRINLALREIRKVMHEGK